jgi:16S rRNA (cytosine967-C5)-methyltransferase
MSHPSKTVSPARRIALKHLERVVRDDAFVGQLEADEGDERDRRQARELVAGTTRLRRRLDFVLAEFYDGDYGSMERRLQLILRLGLYELLHQETPSHAAVDEYVELAKQELRSGAGGLVNGVLRAIDRQRDDLPSPNTGDEAEDLAVRHSHPTWMVRRWVERFGPDETAELLSWNNRRPAYALRVNTRATTVEEVLEWMEANDVTAVQSPFLDDFIRVKSLQPVVRGPLLDEGKVAVQDESAGMVVRLLDPQPGETVVDLCAAPGGKTVYTALQMKGKGRVLAFDQHEGRLGRVGDAAGTHGVGEIVETEAADARALPDRDAPPAGDRVLLDVPCTGLGVLSKRADLRWRRDPGDIEDMAELQDELLDAAARLVKPGGRLVYSTCSTEPEENAQRVDAFLVRQTRFTLESAASTLPDDVVTPDGFYYATLPHRHRVDGAFAAVLRRVE